MALNGHQFHSIVRATYKLLDDGKTLNVLKKADALKALRNQGFPPARLQESAGNLEQRRLQQVDKPSEPMTPLQVELQRIAAQDYAKKLGDVLPKGLKGQL